MTPTLSTHIESKRIERLAIILAAAIFSALSLYMAWHSDSDLDADATTHFVMARHAFKEPMYFTSVWGRPLCTAAYALAAQIGSVDHARRMARVTSLLLALICAAFTCLIASRQGIRHYSLAVILLLAQPLFFLHSFSEMTEIPFATLLMLSFLAYERRWWLLMAISAALLPLGRPEGFAFIALAGVALIAHRRWWWLIVLPIPFLLWNYAGWYLTESKAQLPPHWWTWVVRNNPYSYQSTYGRGQLLSFIARLPVVTSPGFFPFMLVGIVLAIACGRQIAMRKFWVPRSGTPGLAASGSDLRVPRLGTPSRAADRAGSTAQGTEPWHPNLPVAELSAVEINHQRVCEILIAMIPLSILSVHSLLWWKGKMGSNGELRYLLIVGPFFALLGARGWEWAWQYLRWRAPLAAAGIVALLPVTLNFTYRFLPLPTYSESAMCKQLADWYRSDAQLRTDFPRLMPTLPQVFYYMDISQTDSSTAIAAGRQSVEHPPMGALLIWDPTYGEHNASSDMCVMPQSIRAGGWIPYRQFLLGDTYCNIYLSPRTMHGDLTANLSRYPPADTDDWLQDDEQ